ncbi:glycosyl transferase family 1 [Vannielia sp.]|uniref:rhamnosyltransferase WsaF family glycosyltransferase n=1 Tax=Vannielia sp. TaxID=2813045 RepID=UPI002638FAEA|nr:glycosyl transferase family 1 [Vannielia sp.]MDF1872300.1 glycosyl transferase family 1 [Vannielia sp.]
MSQNPQYKSAAATPPVWVVMAVFRPTPDHLRAQIQSIAAQRHLPAGLVLVIADGTSADLAGDIAAEAGITAVLVTPRHELDAVRAFEAGLDRVLELAPAEALIALSDQDDIWHPDRLLRGVQAMADPAVMLSHADARLVDDTGAEIAASMFAFEKRHHAPGLRGLLYQNNVTGMTALFRANVARLALPFPPQSGVHFYHDLWLAMVAAALGKITFINTPLVDYRQHQSNAIGAVDRRSATLPRKLPSRKGMTNWFMREAGAYGLARYLARSLQARLSSAVTSGTLAHGVAQTAPLRPYLRTRSTGFAHLWDGTKLLCTGHPRLARLASGQAIVTLGRSFWSLRLALSEGMRAATERFDTRIYSLSPGVIPPHIDSAGNVAAATSDPAEAHIDPRKHPSWTPVFTADTAALNLLVPTLNPAEVFAGVATALDVGIGLAALGHPVRLIATDLPIASHAASRRFLTGRIPADAAPGTADRLSLACGLHGTGERKDSTVTIPSHKDDVFLTTAWWTAHVARELISTHGYTQPRFAYLIQDFEPNFYAWGAPFAEAMATYSMEYVPVFNTALLRDYFVSQGLASPTALTFRPSIEVPNYSSGTRPSRTGPRRLALYGRPEVERNMFPMAIEALSSFLEAEGLGPDDIELVSIGLPHPPVKLPGGLRLTSLGKLPWEDYPDYLLTVDLGLSLMFSPHPSHPPIEMAASGVRVVTNSFGPKDLSKLSPALISAAPTAEAVTAALHRAWAAAPVTQAEREFSLAPLGLSMDEMLTALSSEITTLGLPPEPAT